MSPYVNLIKQKITQTLISAEVDHLQQADVRVVGGAFVEAVGDWKILAAIDVAGSGITEIVEFGVSVEAAGDCELFSIAVNGSGMTVTVEIRREFLKIDGWKETPDTLVGPDVKEEVLGVDGGENDVVFA
ncbi:MAG: hypothetical protein Q9195_003640 [Heterodermia aff. obscurata]